MDAPEIHSNVFNIKFNKSDGLPTAVPPCDVNMFRKLVDADTDPTDEERWNTCILLPTENEKSTHTFLMWIFSRLYPHALLFLHRLECIKYINLVKGVNLVMRKEVVGDGTVNISNGYGKMTWFVKSSKLPADQIRHDVQTTEISMAFLLDDLDNGNYMAKLYGQQAFAHIRPLSMYGLNFIIQADFIVSSIGEEIDVDSPWNQWLLSEFPNLFVSAERAFCSLPCFKENQAKGVSNFMSFVPLGGEVHGALSFLPHMIISKLRVSDCLLLQGDDNEWVRPCKVVRNWTEQIRSLLPDSLIREHLDFGYLSNHTVIKDSLAHALGIEDCGPKFVVQAMTSICRAGSLKSMGLSWLSSCLNILFLMLANETEYDVINSLSHLPFIPLLDGNYASTSDGAIWLLTGEDDFKMFGKLYRSLKLRIVHPDLFSDHVENVTQMLYKVGVQRLSAHDIIKFLILPAICDEKARAEHTEVMIECLSFIMFHLETSCPDCLVEKEHILSLSHLSKHGYKRLVDVAIHSIEEKMQLFLTNKQTLLKLLSEESEQSISSLEEGELTPKIHSCYVINVIRPPDSTSKKFRGRSRRKTEPRLKDASKTNKVNSDQTRHDEALKDKSGSRIYRDLVTSGKIWVKKVKEVGLASDFVAEDDGNGNGEESAKKIIECIRREEFGLDTNISAIEEDGILKKLNTRFGKELHCLSRELYSQDSHFLLELVQNADDNVYPCDVEPTLTFVLLRTAVIVLTNDQGFSVETIKALCKKSSLSKKESSPEYIGKKGIGFKSVFQVTDAPEIHSNGFHVKFDISDGPIGIVLPKIVPLFDIDLHCKLVCGDDDPTDKTCWKTCIVLPFRLKEGEGFPVEDDLISMFSSFHPSMLLFLHRLKCIKFRNTLNDSLIVMRKQVVKDGIVHVFIGKENFTWFVKSGTLQATDVQTTEISLALMLEDLGNVNDIPKLKRQPDFDLFPCISYGLKFIIQADFVASSSREEVDEHSPWNQWLLFELSNLFVNAEVSFCSLPCFKKNPGKGVSVFMSFVPLEGEVHGVFSPLPRMIISKLRSSSCLLLQGEDNEWVMPCKVLRNWTEQTRSFLPDSLIREHLDVGYLHKDTLLSDSLARALGIVECGPKVLIQVMESLCRADSLRSMGLGWLSSWLNVLFLMLVNATEYDFISSFSQLPILPLLDGSYASINEGEIWLHTDHDHGLEAFGKLYSQLRIVNPALFSEHVENITQMLYKLGVLRLSAHQVVKKHVLPAICDEKVMAESKELMIEYLSFIMFHLESSCCSECLVEKKHILSQLRNKAFISTNYGFKRLVDVPIHFSKEFGNPIDMSKLVGGTDMKWFEIDISYLKHPVYNASPRGMLRWRKFLKDLGVSDFVQIVKVEKSVKDICHTARKPMLLDDDWNSQELMYLLSVVSANGDKDKGVHLLKVLDTLWGDYFSEKPYKSYVLRILHSFRWLASSMDDQLHFPKDLFHNCEMLRDILGHRTPYTVPKVKNVKFLNDICLKKTLTLDVALSILDVWRGSKKPFRAGISQMTNFYAYLWSEMGISKHKIVETLHSQAFIFVPHSFDSTNEVLSGLLLTPSEVYWHDSTGLMEQKTLSQAQLYEYNTHRVFSKMLSSVYPGLRSFFVNEFGVAESPPLLSYLPCLLQLSTENFPSLAAKIVFQVFKKWSDGLDSGVLSSDDIDYLKKSMEDKEMTIIPTVQEKWVSLHQSFGLVCWCDDEQLGNEFKNLKNVHIISFGELTTQEKQMFRDKVSVLFWRLGIPCLSEVVTCEVIHCGPTDSSYMISLVRWALPYAQRYIYNKLPNEYSQLKISGFKNVNSLKIVVVEKLCQKYVIKSFGIESKEHDCCCLLQDNILYATPKVDSHSLFMELARFLLSGIPESDIANFLCDYI